MITAELTNKINTLSIDEYRMVEVYVDNVMEYSRRRKKEAAWDKIKGDLISSQRHRRLWNIGMNDEKGYVKKL